MKNLCLSLISAIALGLPMQAHAKFKIPFGNREVLTKVADLPNTDEYKTADGAHINLGRLHEEYNIAWIMPLSITKEPRLVGIVANKPDEYIDFPEADLKQILSDNKLDATKLTSVGFYSRYGGKIVAGLLIVLIIWGFIPSKKEEIKPTIV